MASPSGAGSSKNGLNGAVHLKKRFFICCDGTWQDGVNNKAPLTNVARFARCIAPFSNDGFLQIVYYDSGVGNGNAWSTPAIDGATGRGISAKIKNAYSFLSHNYTFPDMEVRSEVSGDNKIKQNEGDKDNAAGQVDEIFLVGFSRGAFTVQCLASLIAEIGLLRKDSLQYLRHLFTLWANKELRTLVSGEKPLKNWLRDHLPNLDTADEVRRQKIVKIKACAVWDTVSALGLPLPQVSPRPLAFVGRTVPSVVENAFQALALNESRHHFKPCVWEDLGAGCPNVKQCWFLGSHADVGGGNKDYGLAAISFIWIVSQLKGLGVDLDMRTLPDFLMPDYMKWENRVNDFLGTVKSRMKLDTRVSVEGKVNETVFYWYLTGFELRRKYFMDKTQAPKKAPCHWFRRNGKGKAVPGPAEETSDQHTHDEGMDVEPGDGNNRQFSMCVHFSVRLMMAKGRNKCHVLKKWNTSSIMGRDAEGNEGEEDENDGLKIFWERNVNGSDSQSIKPQLAEDRVGKTERQLLRQWAETESPKGRGPLPTFLNRNSPPSMDVMYYKKGQAPLHRAAANGRDAVVRLLLKWGANTEARDGGGQTPLHRAAANGHDAVVRLLLEKGANTEARDGGGQTPLHRAAANGHDAVVRLLLEKGANANATDHDGETPLSRARGHATVAKLRVLQPQI
ncbi:hypothetical protein ACHAQH_008965 [Verticillium albo-atrum]